MPRFNASAISKATFIGSSAIALFLGGFLVARFNAPPSGLVNAAIDRVKLARDWIKGKPPEGFFPIRRDRVATLARPAEYSPGLTLFAGAGPDRALGAWLADKDGKVVHRWNLPGNAVSCTHICHMLRFL